ncbi:MAG TPA: NAD-dependent epimerase/dehydratase family protein [Gemmatimonadaceae bacterium]|jgi:uncharacterized protein YbjT (DUF2867 family)|nr:NAD-dependent epimerase/dehydratase family protein [Gemmatimonadaceae bacterium]
MKVIVFGATGMIGQGVLRESLLDGGVEQVLTIGRVPTGRQHRKLRDLVWTNLYDLSGMESELHGFDACFFCLGVSAVGMTEEQYTRVTYDLTMSVAAALSRINPDMTFVFVSAAGASSEETGAMWARVRGRTENALFRLPLRAYVFRPGLIRPLHGIKSRTRLYNAVYVTMAPVMPLLERLFPGHVTTTEQIGRAMMRVARDGFPRKVLHTIDINAL